MNVDSLEIEGLKLLTPRVHVDERGSFFEVWNTHKLRDAGLDFAFVQENQSESRASTLRGLHYQILQPQGKLIRVIRGEIFDVAVDLRRSSPTFGRWAGTELTGDTGAQLFIPPGFAHGFLVLSTSAVVVYACTDFYAPEHERTLLWNDPDVGIAWPLEASLSPILSPKDRNGIRLHEAEVFA